MAEASWSVAEAKARFSELIEWTWTEGPQSVSRHGKACVVMVSASDWALGCCRWSASRPNG